MNNLGNKTVADYIPFDEFKGLLEALHADGEYKLEMYFTLSFATGLRISDVLKIKWVDILDVRALNVIEQKTGKHRAIAFSQSTQQKFSDLYRLTGNPKKSGFVVSTRTGSAMDKCNLNKKLKEIKAKYNLSIENFSTHSLRKTFGRYVYETNNKSEESLILLSQILNHSSIAITRRYLGITSDEIKNVYAGISF